MPFRNLALVVSACALSFSCLAAPGDAQGLVEARMAVDGSGEVQWRFNAGAAGRLVEIDVNFVR